MMAAKYLSVSDGTMISIARRTGLALLSLALATGAATAQDVPVVAPGESFTFAEPDVVDGDCGVALIDVCDFVVDEPPLRAFALAALPLQRNTGRAFQYVDFDVPLSEVPGGPPDGIVMAQISGSARIKGFLAVTSVGAAGASVVLKVIDVKKASDTGPVVGSHTLATYGLNTSPSGSVSGSISVDGEGGFPYGGGGGGGSLGISVGVSPKKQIVRDTVDFGFSVLLRRGNRYRLLLELTTSAQNYVYTGYTVSSFFAPDLGGPSIPNLLDPFDSPEQPTTWLSFLEPLSKSLPNLKIGKNVVDQKVGVFKRDLLPAHTRFISAKEKRKKYNTHFFVQLLFPKLGKPPYTLDKIARNSPLLNLANSKLREVLASPGVEQTNLAVTIQDDIFELGNENKNRFIEDSLQTCRTLASLYLPVQFGGQADTAFAVVDYLIMRSLDAGLKVGKAPLLFDKAMVAFGEGFYKSAYGKLCVTYDELVDDDDDDD